VDGGDDPVLGAVVVGGWVFGRGDNLGIVDYRQEETGLDGEVEECRSEMN